MRTLALLLLVGCGAEASVNPAMIPRGCRDRGCYGERLGRGNSGGSTPLGPVLERVPLALSAQCQGESLSVNGVTATYSRAGQSYCWKSDGTYVLTAADTPRIGRMGVLIEPARTQLLTNVRNWAHADWSKSNMTCTQTATGADGAANGGSTCTASANNGTVKQAFTGASAQRAAAFSLKRRTGTGTVEVTADDGTTWCNVTSALATATLYGCSWLRLHTYGDDIRDTAAACVFGCGSLTGTATSYGVGLRLGTSGDAVDVDFAQLEEGHWQTSPISGSSRAQDVITVSAASWPSSPGYFEALITPTWTPQNTDPDYYTVFDTTPSSGVRFYTRSSTSVTTVFIRDGSTGNNDLTSSSYSGGGFNTYPEPIVALMRPRMWRTSWSQYDSRLFMQGYIWAQATSANPPTSHGTAHIGALYDSSLTQQGWLAFPHVGSAVAESRTLVSTIGDSILDGSNTVKVGEAIQFALGWSNYLVRPLALGGTKIATDANNCTLQFNNVVGAGNNIIVYNCAINDILQGATGADTWTAAQTLLNSMIAAGNKVVVATIGPCGGYATCDNTDNATYNASLTSWCTAQGSANCYLADAYTLFNDPNNSGTLKAACDVNSIGGAGDHLHPSASCSILYAQLLATGVQALAASTPTIEFAPKNGAGMTAPCACANVTTAAGVAAPFVRSTTAWCTKSTWNAPANGDLVSCAIDKPRVMTGGSGNLGVMIESAETNFAKRSQEFDNATWVKAGSTEAAPTVTANAATAPDGTLTADRIQFADTTVGYSCVNQPATAIASSGSSTCVFVKGVSGSGTLDLCTSNGVAQTCTSCSFTSTAWTRCKREGVTVGSGTDLYFGNMTLFNGGTARSGSDVYAWGFEQKNQPFCDSYVGPTTGSSVFREYDALDIIGTTAIQATGSAAVSILPTGIGVYNYGLGTDLGASGFQLYENNGPHVRLEDGTNSAFGASTFTLGAENRIAAYWSGSSMTAIAADRTTTYNGTFSGSMPGLGGIDREILVGRAAAGSPTTNGVIKRVCFDTTTTRCR